MTMLEKVKSEPESRGMRIVVNGVPGVGKTGFSTQAPKPLVVTTRAEDGVVTLMAAGQIETPSKRSYGK